jgi:hypothetical protein
MHLIKVMQSCCRSRALVGYQQLFKLALITIKVTGCKLGSLDVYVTQERLWVTSGVPYLVAKRCGVGRVVVVVVVAVVVREWC